MVHNSRTMLGSVLLLLTLTDSLVIGLKFFPGENGYEVVYPRKVHTQHKRDTQSKYPDLVHYELELNGQPLELQLEKNEDLLTKNYTETKYLDDGTPVTTSSQRKDHCYYQGRVKNDNNSQVSLSVCHGLSGFIMTQEQQLLIEPLNKTESGAHAVYTYQAQEASKTCGVNDTMEEESVMGRISFSVSDAEKEAFLKAKKYIEMYVVVDKSMCIKYNRSEKELRERVYGIVNFVNLVYKSLDIFVALTGLEIWDTKDQFEVDINYKTSLKRFSAWRKDYLLPRKPNDNAQFLTAIDFNGTTVGAANIGSLCSDTTSTGVIQDHSEKSIVVGATVAHEMGHNLGIKHDDDSCTCKSKPCIMIDEIGYEIPKEFSSCSPKHYETFLRNKMPLCMLNIPDKNDIVSDAVCGNKFTEKGEECDCGTEEECTNKCCDAKTCQLKQGVQCAEGECCSNCQLKAAGSICRKAKDGCDLSEMCDGISAMCPRDRFRINGHSCRNGEGYCFNGKCPNLQSQCQMHFGQGFVAGSDRCYSNNGQGKVGFCRQSGRNVPCRPKDVKCGLLFCSGGSSNAECQYLGSQVFVEDGTRCGEESVCNRGRCTSIADAYQSVDCSAKCPKNSVCDHELECQCEEGWAPPNCDTSTISAGYIVLIVIVLLVVGIVLALVFVLYKRSQRKKQRRAGASGSGVTNPTFNINQQRQNQNLFPSTPQMGYENVMGPPRPPAPSQKPQAASMYPPQPPANSQKPNVPYAYQKSTTVAPGRPTYPSVPPQAMKPNYRR